MGGEEEGMQEEEWIGGGRVMEAKCLSGPEESDSLCLFENGGGGRSGTWGAGLLSGGVGCVSGSALMVEVRFDSSSRSKESSCTTTFATSATCGVSSHVRVGEEDRDKEGSLCALCSASSCSTSSGFLSASPPNVADSSSSSSSLSSEFPKPSCARALAIFLR